MLHSAKWFCYKHIYENNFNNLGDTCSSIKIAIAPYAWATPGTNISRASTPSKHKNKVLISWVMKSETFLIGKFNKNMLIVYKVYNENE